MVPAAPKAEVGLKFSKYKLSKNLPKVNSKAVKRAPAQTDFQEISTSGKTLNIKAKRITITEKLEITLIILTSSKVSKPKY